MGSLVDFVIGWRRDLEDFCDRVMIILDSSVGLVFLGIDWSSECSRVMFREFVKS